MASRWSAHRHPAYPTYRPGPPFVKESAQMFSRWAAQLTSTTTTYHLHALLLMQSANKCPLFTSSVQSYLYVSCWTHTTLAFNHVLLSWTPRLQCIQAPQFHWALLPTSCLILALLSSFLRTFHLRICLYHTRSRNQTNQNLRILSTLRLSPMHLCCLCCRHT